MFTYSSPTNLGLGQVPQLENAELYEALLDIHNAIEKLLIGSDKDTSETNDDVTKLAVVVAQLRAEFDALEAVLNSHLAREASSINIAADYTMVATNNMVLVNASANDVTITLPAITASLTLDFTIKVVAKDIAYAVTLVGSDGTAIDGQVAGIGLHLFDSITVKADPTLLTWSIA